MLTIHLLVYCPVIAQLTLVPVLFPFHIELSTLGPLAGHLQMQSVAIHRDQDHFLLPARIPNLCSSPLNLQRTTLQSWSSCSAS